MSFTALLLLLMLFCYTFLYARSLYACYHMFEVYGGVCCASRGEVAMQKIMRRLDRGCAGSPFLGHEHMCLYDITG